MADIDWNLKRQMYYDANGEYWVRVPTGFMLVDDYIHGGHVEDIEPRALTAWENLGKFTNAQIDNCEYVKKES